MALPQHIKEISEERAAIAPYNFVPLPEKVVWAEESFAKVRHNVYMLGRATGSITCTLTTESPLYVRCALTAKQFKKWGDKRFWELTPQEQERYAQFFHTESSNHPVIPGSSLRGMLRALVEIASYSKMEQVTSYTHYSYRAVANDNLDPLRDIYKEHLKNVKAGFLIYTQQGWFIRPAREIKGSSYWRILENHIPNNIGLIRFNEEKYHPQYIEISLTDKIEKRRIREVGSPEQYLHKGVLVTSGNMMETNKKEQSINNSPRKNHYIVPYPNNLFDTEKVIVKRNIHGDLPIDPQAIIDYCVSLTEFQRDQFDERLGMLEHGRPVFYCHPEPQQPVIYFGQSPNFRIPYRPDTLHRSATPRDFVPSDVFDQGQPDLAEAIFGYVRDGKQCAGRIFISNAVLCEGQVLEDVLYNAPITPRILASPKPTTFQHYLTQSSDRKLDLHHYENSSDQTVVRGHKLYWHQGNVSLESIQEQETERIENALNQYTKIRPVKPHTHFRFTIRFENLSHIELGALLWVLRIADSDLFRLKLGMGKPLGMGSIKVAIEQMKVSGNALDGKLSNERTTRYSQLFDKNTWKLGERIVSDGERDAYIKKFSDYVLKYSGEREKGCATLADTLRIRCLLALLTWNGTSEDFYQHHPDREKTRYMEIERTTLPRLGVEANEYKERRVLPNPLQVIGEIPDVGQEIIGQCSGLMNDDTQNIKVIIQDASPHVIGVISNSYALRNSFGKIKARVVRHEVKPSGTIHIWLEPFA
ncbi:MAG: TIGR03986 family CRISPR-associated RAMP protein [Roseiflexaceae bacterium]|nr:TIGR03986 family CRISPR-associated RAMP protein [Roseiflexaceae bacterium]